ncbi:hypothetical protein BCAR13_60089 [Paraburkholderia caribensis]|nr:hypothetical protein BCAR13_60089 [Paraburkholderia caribensis]
MYGHLCASCLLVLHLQNSVHQNCVKIKRGTLHEQLAFTLVVQRRTEMGRILVVSLHVRVISRRLPVISDRKLISTRFRHATV